MPPKFQYRARKTEDVEKRATQKGNDYAGAFIDGIKVYKKRDGENWIRVLPPTWTIETYPEYCNSEGPNHYGIDVWLHEYFGPGGSTAICNLKMLWEKSCFLCTARMRAEDAGDEEEAKQLKPRKKVLIGLVDMKDEAAGDQFWLMPWGLDRDIAIVSKDRRSGDIYLIDDPDDGYGVFFDVTGKDIGTKYVGASLERKPTSITNAQLDYIIDHPLPTVLQHRTNDELEALYGGDPVDDDRRRGRRSEREERGRDRDEDRGRGRDREPESIDRGRERSREREPEPEPERTRRRDPEPEPERRPTRGDSRDASGATSRSESSEDVTARSETRTSRSRGRDEENPTDGRDSTTRARSAEREAPASTSRSREAEPEPSRPTTRSRTTVEDADTRSSSASANQRQRTRVAEPEPEPVKHSTGGDERPKSRAEQLRERFKK